MEHDETLVDAFEEHRALLNGVAYRMLGRAADAEDVVQEAWLRWSRSARAEVRDTRGYLVRTVSRLAIDRLRQIAARREVYVSAWLPEPVHTDLEHSVPDVAERAVLAESVSLAVLVVLESLSPLERAVFVLREAFGFGYADIADFLDRSVPAVRQVAGRARRHVEAREPRFDVDPERQRVLTERFMAAASDGDLRELLSLLAPDAELVADSGGKAKAPRRVIETADKVARFTLAVTAQSVVGVLEPRLTEINGGTALLLLADGRPDTVVILGVRDDRVRTVYVLRNPDKLSGLAG